jgi:hypothetical protein
MASERLTFFEHDKEGYKTGVLAALMRYEQAMGEPFMIST